MEFRLLVICFAIFYRIHGEWVKEMENDKLYQGDILLDKGEDPNKPSAAYSSIKGGRWPGGKVPYMIGDDIGSRGVDAILKAISKYEEATCLRFNERTDEVTYLQFYKGDTCYSPIGYKFRRVNRISLAANCWYMGIVLHEIGHSLGLYHEQNRPDRDEYVTILWDNIKPGAKPDFDKYDGDLIDSLEDTPYDYESIMHYGERAFGIDGQVTIQTRDPTKQHVIGQKKGLSELDKKQLRRMYGKLCRSGRAYCVDMKAGCTFWSSKGFCVGGALKEWMDMFCCQSCAGSKKKDEDSLTKLGCFNNDVQPLSSSKFLFSERDNIVWTEEGFKQFVHSLLKDCMEHAKVLGYTFFSIRFYGECWGGKDTSTMKSISNNTTLHSNQCISGDGKFTKGCDVESGPQCVGVANTAFVYLL